MVDQGDGVNFGDHTNVNGDVVAGDKITNTTFDQRGQHVETQHITNYYGSAQPSKPIPIQRPARAEHFTDRKEALDKLLSDLAPGRVVTLCGPGGIGKSALTAEVLWTLAPGKKPPEKFPDGIVFYTFYGKPSVEIALTIMVSEFGEEAKEKAKSNPYNAAMSTFANLDALLVLDGAEDADNLKQILNIRGRCGVLISSRSRNDIVEQSQDITPLPNAEAVELLKKWAGKYAGDDKTGQQICEFVAELPLAVEIIGRYLYSVKENANVYLEWLNDVGIKLLEVEKGDHKRNSVAILLSRSVEPLSKQAREILSVVGLLAFSSFSVDLIMTILDLSKRQAREALGELINLSFLNYTEEADSYQIIHALVHTYAREEVEKEEIRCKTLVEKVVSGLDKLFPVMVAVKPFENREILRNQVIHDLKGFPSQSVPKNEKKIANVLIPHITEVLRLIEKMGFSYGEDNVLFERTGDYLTKDGWFIQAAAFYQFLLTSKEKNPGADLREIATLQNKLGKARGDQGMYVEAETLLTQSLTTKENLPNQDLLEIAEILTNLGKVVYRLGKYSEAELFFQRGLSIRQKMLDSDHIQIGDSLHALARLYETKGSKESEIYYEQSEIYYQRVMEIYEEKLDPLDLELANALNNFAWLYHQQKKFDDAEPLYNRTLAIRESQDNPNPAAIGNVLTNIGILYHDQGKYSEAESTLLKALTLRQIGLGKEHPYLIFTLDKLVELYIDLKYYEKAEPYCEQALEIAVKKLPSDHKDTKMTINAYLKVLEGLSREDKIAELKARFNQ